ncbi:MAG: hypothetical protein J7K61_03405 [Thermoplasmata archaeon]|nr:hypothetical protein [Thermoplasmata archaeon]
MKRLAAITAFFILLAPSFVNITYSEDNALPSRFSWRDVNGVDYTTPIKNQAPAPTCEAYALVAILETKMQYMAGRRYNPDLSEAHLYFYAGGTIKAGYVNIVDAANYLVEHGVPDEGCFPDPHRPYDFPFESLPGWEERAVKIKEWGWVKHDEESIKKALIEHGPLAVCMIFYRDFYYYHGGVYHHKWGGIAGGHVMAIVGYDDSEHCWIIKNSWGKEWGEDGWLRMDYDALWIGEWYGNGTGVMYLEGVYGNLMPDVPRVYIEEPKIFHTYIFGREFSTIFRKIPGMQEAAPRIIGGYTLKVNATNTQKVEFYVDGSLAYTDNAPPYEWRINCTHGLHTIDVYAYSSNGNISKDEMDIFVI